ncbi:MAG: NUDIX hydrolase [Patescibacteria group bacterium]
MRIVDIFGEDFICDYREERAAFKPLWLGDGEYGRAMNCAVFSTYDVLCRRPDGKFLLLVRQIQPLKGLCWFSGGRQMTGTSVPDTLRKNTKRELGIDIADKEPVFLVWASIACEKREQLPQEDGSHTTTHVFLVDLTEADVAELLPNNEFESQSIGWYSPAEIQNGEFHDFVKRCARIATRVPERS